MALTVATNTGALMAQAAASSVNKEMEMSMERLSTGKRINSAADDAAGVAIVSRLTSEIRGTNQAIRSIQQIGDTIGAVNDVALEFAAVSSSDALDAATVLMQQSEELRGKLDDLLGKIKLEGGGLPNYSSGEPE